ncbi:hypothetical protein [Spirobacillus cienkowskii]|uniref:hypothetical protein n=1 Tax=Spirobacillus cienkowskii TaxID=495820 RepID=UPI0030D20E17
MSLDVEYELKELEHKITSAFNDISLLQNLNIQDAIAKCLRLIESGNLRVASPKNWHVTVVRLKW